MQVWSKSEEIHQKRSYADADGICTKTNMPASPIPINGGGTHNYQKLHLEMAV